MTRSAHLEKGNKHHKTGRKTDAMSLTEALGKAQANGVKGVTDLFQGQSCLDSNMPDPCSVKVHNDVPGVRIL